MALMAVPIAAHGHAVSQLQTPVAAMRQDAAEYARQYGVDIDEAVRRLNAAKDSVPATDRLRDLHADRFVGMYIEHVPRFGVVMLLTGKATVADDVIDAGGISVPVTYRTGASATRHQLLVALEQHRDEMRTALASRPGVGLDPRTGTLVVAVGPGEIARDGRDFLEARFTAIAGVPVRVRALEPGVDLAMAGGARVIGSRPDDARRFICTTGFVVSDGARSGIVTAAHCPDALNYAERGEVASLDFAGQWGWGYQDVQVNVGTAPLQPAFFADTAKTLLRPVTGSRARASTRSGDFVCHRGERTGYSCAEVELTDFAPAGELCGGACLPSWVTVAGPGCRAGDSGSPVFSGTTAFGILKGGSYRADGSCAFYFYMSIDYLPDGWTLSEDPGIGSSEPAIAVRP